MVTLGGITQFKVLVGVFYVMENVSLIKRTKNLKEDFLITHNKLVQNANISFQAKGLLVMILSLPSDWVLHKSWIMKEYKIGRDRLNKMFKELINAGYLIELEMLRENGKFKGKNYMVYDTPQNGTKEISPMYRKPSTVNPSTEKPLTENSTPTKDISINSTEQKKEHSNTNSTSSVFSFSDIQSNGQGTYVSPLFGRKT